MRSDHAPPSREARIQDQCASCSTRHEAMQAEEGEPILPRSSRLNLGRIREGVGFDPTSTRPRGAGIHQRTQLAVGRRLGLEASHSALVSRRLLCGSGRREASQLDA